MSWLCTPCPSGSEPIAWQTWAHEHFPSQSYVWFSGSHCDVRRKELKKRKREEEVVSVTKTYVSLEAVFSTRSSSHCVSLWLCWKSINSHNNTSNAIELCGARWASVLQCFGRLKAFAAVFIADQGLQCMHNTSSRACTYSSIHQRFVLRMRKTKTSTSSRLHFILSVLHLLVSGMYGAWCM